VISGSQLAISSDIAARFVPNHRIDSIGVPVSGIVSRSIAAQDSGVGHEIPIRDEIPQPRKNRRPEKIGVRLKRTMSIEC
jgi:hypothetical protein